MRRSLRILTAVIVAVPLGLGFGPAVVQAATTEVYSWVDAAGVRQFSQQPPPKGTPYRRLLVESGDVAPKPAPAADAKAPARDTRLRGGPATREAGLRLKAETMERCAKARERIRFLEEKTARRLFIPSPDGGEPARMTDEQFEAELQQARKLEADHCV